MVPESTRRAGPLEGNGIVTTFAFGFKTNAAADLRVVKLALGVETTLTLNSHYSVTLNADQEASPGGDITYPISGSPLAADEFLTIISDLAIEQQTDLPNLGAFYPAVIESALDRAIMLIGQQQEVLDRSITLQASVSGVAVELPTPSANLAIGWNATGDALANIASPGSLTSTTTGLALLNAANETAARTILSALGVDLTLLTALSGAIATGDLLALYDVSASAIRKVTYQVLMDNIVVLAAEASPAVGDSVLLYDLSETATNIMSLSNLLKVVNGLTEDTSPDRAADFVLTYDTSASDVKKVKPKNLSPFSSEYMSANQTITAAGPLTLAHGLPSTPKLILGYLVCVNGAGALGYAVNDVVAASLGAPDSGSNRGVSVVADATNLNVRFGSDGSTFTVIRKDTGATAIITNADWNLRLVAWA